MRPLALLYAALFVLISGCATTSGQPRKTPAQLQSLGEKCMEAGQTADALTCLTEAAQKKPNDATLEYDLALAYNQRGLPDKALSHLQNALKIKPNYPEALNTLGFMYATRGQIELARGAFQKALDDPFYKTPQLPAYNLGKLYEKSGDIEKALSYYRQAVNFDQQYGAAWLQIGLILEQLSRSDEARHAYGNALSASPDLAQAQLRFGILSYQAGNFEAALFSLSRVGKIAPNTDMADEARKYLEKVDASLNTKTRSRASPYIPPGNTETISEGEIQHLQSKDGSPSGTEINPTPAAQKATPAAPKTQVPDAGNIPAQGEIAAGPASQSYRYMVQIGSFEDKDKAEEIKSRLQEKGYSAVVRPLQDRALGKVFVIQLQPVNSVSKATTLKTQLSGEIEGEPEIVKVPLK